MERKIWWKCPEKRLEYPWERATVVSHSHIKSPTTSMSKNKPDGTSSSEIMQICLEKDKRIVNINVDNKE